MRIERKVPSEELEPGKIPRFHIRYGPVFCLDALGDNELKEHCRGLMNGVSIGRIVISDMGEVVVIFKEPWKTP
ncbi:MAG: hypothetical protein HYS83_01585 [Candidatus Blackburnbacteria bacterium]|nr:hypothetical protein [Candidatus Blackburnbacteria bacterium]